MFRILLVASLLFAAGICNAQTRSAGLAEAGSAIISGADAPLLNPARLVSLEGPCLRVIDTYGAVSNNSYSVGDYRAYNGTELSETDEDALLAKIPGDALEARGILSIYGFAYRHRSWAIGIRTQGNIEAKVPKDLFRLLLDGNRPGETFTFDATDGSGELVGEVFTSHAREVQVPRLGPLSLGVSLKWILGWYHAGIQETSGRLRTDAERLDGSGELRARTATGGQGFGIDVGGWREFDPSWSASIAVRNLLTNIWWTRGTEQKVTRATVRDWTLQDLEDDADLLETEDEDQPIGFFRTSVPPLLTAGIAHSRGRWTFVADVSQGFTESLHTTRMPRLAIGTEVTALPWIVGRTGFSVGGLDRRSLALGLGLSPGIVQIDFVLSARDGYFPFTGRGIGAGFALGIDF